MNERDLLRAAASALRSYQHGNASPDLAKEIADKIDEVLKSGFTDTERLDFLEKDLENDPLLIFNETPRDGNRGFRGLGLRCTGRSLREALAQIMLASGKKLPS